MINHQRVDVSEVGDVTIVHFRDRRITEDRRIGQTARELLDLVEVENRRKLIVSFASVDCLSSAGLGKLITLDKRLAARGGALKLAALSPDLRTVFFVTRLDRLFDIEPDDESALAAFSRETQREGVPVPAA